MSGAMTHAMGSATVAHAFRQAVLETLGHAPEVIEPGRCHRFPTKPHGGSRSGWCKLFDDLSGGAYGCFRLGISRTWFSRTPEPVDRAQRLAQARQVLAVTQARQAGEQVQWAKNDQRLRALWAACQTPQPGDPVALYLARRGFGHLQPVPACLRLHPSLPCWDEGQLQGHFPAMVAPLVAPDGRMVALHRTYLTPDGRKAAVPTPKKLTPAAGPLAGASIPLHRPRAGVLGVAEGIETALGGWQASGVPTVAAYCAGNLAAFQWPAGVHSLLVFADADAAGRAAASQLQRRAVRAGVQVQVLTPEHEGDDWGDVWTRCKALRAEELA